MMTAAPIEESLARVRSGIERRIARVSELVGDHLAGFIGRPGKMLRSRYALLLGSALGVEPERSERAACAVELVHNASLLHDDCVDEALLRRGLPTPNGLFGRTAGVLLGDLAFAEGLDEAADLSTSAARRLVDTAREMTAGELQEEFLRGSANVSVEGYLGVVARKTGALFEWVGAALSEQSPLPHRKDDPPSIGRAAGQVLQIVDDIHDFTLDKDTAGKEPGQDLLLGKLTLPSILALDDEALRPRFLELWNRAPRDRAMVAEAVSLLRAGGCFEAARARARGALDAALPRVAALPVRDGAERLTKLLEAMARREF
jgi:heptaprenyl diphosphate synthase